MPTATLKVSGTKYCGNYVKKGGFLILKRSYYSTKAKFLLLPKGLVAHIALVGFPAKN
jgi:hypothetical protein